MSERDGPASSMATEVSLRPMAAMRAPSPTQADTASVRDARPIRGRLDIPSASPTPRSGSMSPVARSAGGPFSPASQTGAFDRASPGRLSRIAGRALGRMSSQPHSASERSSRPTKDPGVYRDERGRRIDRPRSVRAEVNLVGELVGATDFPARHGALFCRYRLVCDGSRSWVVQRGADAGCTQVSSAPPRIGAGGEDTMVVWEHPLDIQLSTQKLECWPRVAVKVFARDDATGRDLFVSYGVCPLPITPGLHHVSLRTWAATEPGKQHARQTLAMHLGMAPRLEDDLSDTGFVTDAATREDAGGRIASVGSGLVHFRLQIITRKLEPLCRQAADHLYVSLDNFTDHLEAASKRQAALQSIDLDAAEQAAREHQPSISAGLRQVRAARAGHFEAAQRTLSARPTPSREGSVTYRRRSLNLEALRASASASPRLGSSTVPRRGAVSAPRTYGDPFASASGALQASGDSFSAATGALPDSSPGSASVQGVGRSSAVRDSKATMAANIDLQARQAERAARRRMSSDSPRV